MKIIEVADLSFAYEGAHLALDHLSLEVQKGSTTAILGGNGSGKSTLFLNLNGVLVPNSGQIFFAGKAVTFNKRGVQELRRKIGIVFQDPNDQLFAANVASDIAFGALNLGLSQAEATARVKKVAKWLEIEELLERPTHALSFGQKKRVALAGVLVMEPQVIILDEPTAGLDPSGVSEMLKLLTRLKSEMDLTILLSTHEIDLVPLYADAVYVLNKGKVVLAGTPKEIFSEAEILRNYGLRLPRIAHLMGILSHKDKLPVDPLVSTIGAARKCIRELAER